MRILDFSDSFESEVQPTVSGVAASEIAFTPTGTIAATNVQTALAEVDTEKIAKVASTDNAIVRFDSTGGAVQNSGVTVDDSNNVIIPGNLTVQGTTTTFDVANLEVEDKNILINNGGNDATSEGAGLTVERTATNATIQFESALASKFKAGLAGAEVELANVSSAQTLSSKTLTAPIIDAVSFTEQGSTPATPSAGTKKLYTKTDGKVYTVNSAGTETEVGSGSGSGGINYIDNCDFETNTTGWVVYADAAAATPVDGTGGSPTSTFTRTTTAGEVLRGTASGELNHPAALLRGEGISYDFTVDPQDSIASKTLVVSFDYKTTTNYLSDDIRVFVYDRDGATLLNVLNGDSGSLKKSINPTRFVGTFSTVVGNNDYRLILHQTTDGSGMNWDIHIDNVKVTPEQTVPGAIVTETTSYTPTFTGFGTAASVSVNYSRQGDILRISGRFTSGTSTATEARISLPTGYTAKAVLGAGGIRIPVGRWFRDNASATTEKAGEMLAVAGNAYVTMSTTHYTPALSPLTNRNGSSLAGAGEVVSFIAEIPIEGAASAALSTTETMFQSSSWSGFHLSDSSWARTNAALGDPTADATSTFTEVSNFNMGTVTSALSGSDKLPGIVFTPRTANRYKITANFGNYGPATTLASLNFQLIDGSGNILALMGRQIQSIEQEVNQSTLVGILVPTAAGTSHTVKIQSSSSTGAVTIAGIGRSINWTIEQIPNFTTFSVYGVTDYQESKSPTFTAWPVATDVYFDLTSLVLQPGEYDLTGISASSNNGVVAAGFMRLAISTTAGNSAAGLSFADNMVGLSQPGTTGHTYYQTLPNYRVVVTTPTTYYLKTLWNAAVTNLQYGGYKFSARKVK